MEQVAQRRLTRALAPPAKRARIFEDSPAPSSPIVPMPISPIVHSLSSPIFHEPSSFATTMGLPSVDEATVGVVSINPETRPVWHRSPHR
ncbi:unnamed protein product, partial [Ilex paraguariensis]